ncbi:hypothetical protein PMAYCL1PPCAC_24117, partial [Pristionchus mayeri]
YRIYSLLYKSTMEKTVCRDQWMLPKSQFQNEHMDENDGEDWKNGMEDLISGGTRRHFLLPHSSRDSYFGLRVVSHSFEGRLRLFIPIRRHGRDFCLCHWFVFGVSLVDGHEFPLWFLMNEWILPLLLFSRELLFLRILLLGQTEVHFILG